LDLVRLNLPGLAYCELSPREAIRQLSKAVLAFEQPIRAHVLPRLEAASACGLAEVVCLARQVVEWEREAPGQPLPTRFHLPGLARLREMAGDDDLLAALAFPLQKHAALLLDRVSPGYGPVSRLELVEALALAERVVFQEGCQTAYGEDSEARTPLLQL